MRELMEGKDIHYSREITLEDIAAIHLAACNELSSTIDAQKLKVRFSTQPRFISRFNKLSNSLFQGMKRENVEDTAGIVTDTESVGDLIGDVPAEEEEKDEDEDEDEDVVELLADAEDAAGQGIIVVDVPEIAEEEGEGEDEEEGEKNREEEAEQDVVLVESDRGAEEYEDGDLNVAQHDDIEVVIEEAQVEAADGDRPRAETQGQCKYSHMHLANFADLLSYEQAFEDNASTAPSPAPPADTIDGGGGSSVLKRGLSHPADEVVEDAAGDGTDKDQGRLSVLPSYLNHMIDAKRIKR